MQKRAYLKRPSREDGIAYSLYVIFGLLILYLIFAECAQAAGFNGKCPQCVAEGKRSFVYVGSVAATVRTCDRAYYDEDGKYNPPDSCGDVYQNFTCNRGHKFSLPMDEVYYYDKSIFRYYLHLLNR